MSRSCCLSCFQFSKALILVDLENEWLDKESDNYASGLKETIPAINRLIDYCRSNHHKIIFIRHIEKDSDGAFSDRTKSSEIISDLHRNNSDTVITKHAIGSFYQTNLDEELKGIDNLVVSGILTNLCVRSLVSDAYDRGLKITVISDCCVAFDERTQNFTLNDLKSTREEIDILTLDDFVK